MLQNGSSYQSNFSKLKLQHVQRIAILAISLVLTACFTARSETASIQCELVTKSWTLDFDSTPPSLSIASNKCNSAECLLSFIVSGSVVTAGSFIVSGSIVLVGNTLHWLEKNSVCQTTTVKTALDSFRNGYGTVHNHMIATKDDLIALFK